MFSSPILLLRLANERAAPIRRRQINPFGQQASSSEPPTTDDREPTIQGEPRVIRIPGDGTNVRRGQSSSNFGPRFPSGRDCLQAPTIVQRFRALDDRGLLSPVFRQRPRPPTSSHVLDLRSATEAPSGGLRPTSPSFRQVEPSDSREFRRLRTTRRTEEGRSAELQPLSRAKNRLNRAPFFLCFSRERETLCDIPAV
ncbi:transcriptional repressor NrdR, partial [Striga asiatica]